MDNDNDDRNVLYSSEAPLSPPPNVDKSVSIASSRVVNPDELRLDVGNKGSIVSLPGKQTTSQVHTTTTAASTPLHQSESIFKCLCCK